VTYYDQFWK